jgi:hypothetical protein
LPKIPLYCCANADVTHDVGFWTQSNGLGTFLARSFWGARARDEEIESVHKVERDTWATNTREAADAFCDRKRERDAQRGKEETTLLFLLAAPPCQPFKKPTEQHCLTECHTAISLRCDT